MAFPASLDTSDPAKVGAFLKGRDFINFQRRFKALHRAILILETWSKNPKLSQSQLAEKFGVHRSTIGRTLKLLKSQKEICRCPLCGNKLVRSDKELVDDMLLLKELTKWTDSTRKFLAPK